MQQVLGGAPSYDGDVMLALFLDEVLYGKIPDGVYLERRFLTALNTACNALDCFFFGIIEGHLGIDLNPFERNMNLNLPRGSL